MSTNNEESDTPTGVGEFPSRLELRLAELGKVAAGQDPAESGPRVHFSRTAEETAPSERVAPPPEHTPQPDALPRRRIRRKIGGAATAQTIEPHDEPQDSRLSPAARTRIMATAAKITEERNAKIAAIELSSLTDADVAALRAGGGQTVQRRSLLRVRSSSYTEVADIETRLERRKLALTRDASLLKESFRGQTSQSPIDFPRHQRQTYVGNDPSNGRIFSCVPASMANAVKALGVTVPHSTEDDFLRELKELGAYGAPDARRPYASTDLGAGMMHERGLMVRQISGYDDHPLSLLFQGMAEGGVAIMSSASHARLISGFEVENGDIKLRINDPLFKDKMELVGLDDVVSELSGSDSWSMMLITKP